MNLLARSPTAVTGMGLITPLGDQPEAAFAAMLAGHTSVEDVAEPEQPASSKLIDFDPRHYVTIRGVRVYARNTQLQICAAALALKDAGLSLEQLDPRELGVVSASSYSHMESLLEYDLGLATVGIQRTNPTLMPLSLPSAPGSLTALALNAKAFAVTLSDGASAGLSALSLADRMLRDGRAEQCVVVAAWTDCAELTLSAQRAGLLTDRTGFHVFERGSRGTVFGELAVAFVLEPAFRAAQRGKQVRGLIRGCATTFACDPSRQASSLVRAAKAAFAATRATPLRLSLVSAGASGCARSDDAEARALYELLGDERPRVCVIAPKSSLGESLDASGLMQAATALLALRAGVAPPILGLRDPSVPGLHYLTRARELAAESALVTSISHAGSCSALTLSVSHD